MARLPVALQLFTVRELLAKDYDGTLRRAKELGYDIVQLTGKLPYDAAKMKATLDGIGLGVAGIHIALADLEADLDRWINYCRTVGTKDLVCPYLPEELRGSRDDWLGVAATLERLGARCAEAGMRLSYHNHSFEFVKLNGQYALDLLYEKTDPEHLYAEIDTYWVKDGGEDPVEYILRYAGRLPLLHIKDMADDAERSFAEIGNGILDWEAIRDAAVEAGVEVLCVEQDRCPGDPIESARISLEFLRGLLAD